MESKILESAGLTRNESIVYLTLLQIGTSKTGEILKKSGLNSGKIYEILNSLMNKGLVSISIIDNVKYFTAAPPKELLEYIDKKKELLKKEENDIKSIIPQLEGLRNLSDIKTKVTMYTGFKGLKTAANIALDLMDNNQETLILGAGGDREKKFDNFWKSYQKIKNKKCINTKIIFSKRNDYYNAMKQLNKVETKVLSEVSEISIGIYGINAVLILNYKSPYTCTLIQDENIVKSFINFFNQLWKIAKT